MRKNNKPQTKMSLLINTFSSNQLESSHSEEILFICKSKHIPIEAVIDINQDKTFEYSKSKCI